LFDENDLEIFEKHEKELIEIREKSIDKKFIIDLFVNNIKNNESDEIVIRVLDLLINLFKDDINKEYLEGIDLVLFNKNQTTLIQYPWGNANISYTIPNSVTSIGVGSFAGCSSLTSIIIPTTDIAELRAKIHQERRIELALEWERFFDLVRWDEAKTAITGFVVGKHELFPIPQTEIDKSEGRLTQNPGY
jgi:hypothetical protein